MINSSPISFPNTSHLFLELKSKLIELYGDIYFKYHDKDADDVRKYFSVQSSVARTFLLSLYNEFISKEECLPLESLDVDSKNRYWRMSSGFFQDKTARINVCRTMYVMDLITGTIK